MILSSVVLHSTIGIILYEALHFVRILKDEWRRRCMMYLPWHSRQGLIVTNFQSSICYFIPFRFLNSVNSVKIENKYFAKNFYICSTYTKFESKKFISKLWPWEGIKFRPTFPDFTSDKNQESSFNVTAELYILQSFCFRNDKKNNTRVANCW